MRVAVIGAGIGGLCAAIGLDGGGAEVTVFEQAPEVRAGGSGISVFGNGLRALDEIGMGEAFRAVSSAQAAAIRGGQRRPDGRWLARSPMDALSELRVVDRAPLHELLRSALPARAVRTGARVTAAGPSGEVTWTPGGGEERRERFDLVVAADGIGSRIRRSLPHDPGVAYSGYATWRGITDRPVDLRGEAAETWGTRKRFGIAPLDDGRVYWFAVLTSDRDERFADDRAALTEHFGSWHDPIPELLAATAADRISFLPIDELAGPLPSFVHGRIALLGDAAHAMTPNLGQGGGQAMEDAATLAALFAPVAGSAAVPEPVVHASLARYDSLRVGRTQTVTRRSRMVGRLAHTPGPRLTWARDVLIRAMPSSALRRQLAWLQDWTPLG
ncbi:FAD-dependent monooxygenase [Leucobacter sp. M11]|uniref:FAD-dependent monooxygenase n=1 Tax=Leucobacter sp. M11 TaxID=2993565 RepID=UPI002D805AC0|nr:FAD-dependent monooxygenase [Leucobacter sp. M11]MEB4613117.1 FAD-dependent monooxygenase [Leucobacter sp. M11]